MDRADIRKLWTMLASGWRGRVVPFVEWPVNAWVHVYEDGSCGGDYETRAEARAAKPEPMVQCRIVKAQVLHWFGQPLRLTGGPVITHVRQLARYGSAVYTVGRSRTPLTVRITEVVPLNGTVKRALFKGVIVPFAHAPKARDKKR